MNWESEAQCFVLSVLEGKIKWHSSIRAVNTYGASGKNSSNKITIDFSFQNTQIKTFENPAIPRYSLKNWPEELGLKNKTGRNQPKLSLLVF